MDRESCRPRIRKAERLGCAVSLNQDFDQARALINETIRRLRYRDEVGDAEWQDMLPTHDILVCKCQELPQVAHALLRDFPGRIRQLMSGSADRNDPRFRDTVSPANRFLHWHEIKYYKAAGYRFYDLGGIQLGKSSSEPDPQL